MILGKDHRGGKAMPTSVNRDQLPRLWLAVAVVGLIVGVIVGYLVAAVSQYTPFPPFDVPYLILFYGLGVAVVLLCQFGKHMFPPRTRMHLLPFSVAFACAYYFGCFVYFLLLYRVEERLILI